jgi:peptide/nickel transport system ATP-binding protein
VHPANEISGGQRQRVVIAGAMVLQPELLVADVPVSSLDASVRGEILQLMLGLVRDTGIAILVVTHDPRPRLEHRRPRGRHGPG